MENKFEQLYFVRDTMLENPNVESRLVWLAAKIAEEDKYLYDLMLDWMKEINDYNKSEMLAEVINYTDEFLRKTKVKNASN